MHRILLIDSYDSFTNNLAALCRLAIPDALVYIIKNNAASFKEIRPLLSCFSAVIVGPGPGSPVIEKDVGIIKSLFHLPESENLPIFGVCLGLQSMAIEHGATIHRLNVVKHGQISSLIHNGQDIFSDIGNVSVTRYHSLHVRLEGLDDLQELAHVDDGLENGRVVMAIRHRTKPLWAVQYHPESIRTSKGSQVMANFWYLAVDWLTRQGRYATPWTPAAQSIFGCPWPTLHASPFARSPKTGNTIAYHQVAAPGVTVTDICEALTLEKSSSSFVLLESVADPGRFSIIGVLHANSPRFTHVIGDSCISISHGESHCREDLGEQNIWSWVASFMGARRFTGGDPIVPFWGGLVGYISYEMGVNGLGISSSGTHPQTPPHGRHPDVQMVYVERSIVHDKETGSLCIQSLLPFDPWIRDTTTLLGNPNTCTRLPKPMHPPCTIKAQRLRVKFPSKDHYISRIRRCQEYLATGESYELCLTARTHVTLPLLSPFNSSWELYKSARRHNPAPYSAYLRLHPSTIISTSPERFLSFSRPPNVRCQLRPIKGTVRKTGGVDRTMAKRLLAGSNKEVAENLMIVDLIRHDLHGVIGSNVEVTQFCGVEEYETVWQMVSVIEGELSQPHSGDEDELGWKVLRNSLPPGSMTGAPKKRSVEILNTLEDDKRGIYSGVLGYWDVGGGGDWAVTIRTCVHHADEQTDGTTWTIGAGGAITALSNPEAEWEEMLLKLQGVLNAFSDA